MGDFNHPDTLERKQQNTNSEEDLWGYLRTMEWSNTGTEWDKQLDLLLSKKEKLDENEVTLALVRSLKRQ